MKKGLFIGLCVLLMSVVFCENILAAEEPKPEAASAILMDVSSGRTLYEKDADARLYPASTTKIMTGILAIERLDMSAAVTVSASAVDVERDGSNMGLLTDEQLTAEQLVYGLLVHSANDAANALAEQVSGSVASFVELMNAKAAELGMVNTHFVNPHGYHDDNHYTSARDLALLCDYAVKNEIFKTVVGTAQYQIPPTNKYKEVRHLSSNNALINPNKGRTFLYSPAKGIKTGHTSMAGACLTSYAEQDGMSLIAVVLKAPSSNASFKDSLGLLKYGFNSYEYVQLGDTGQILATSEVEWAKNNDKALFHLAEPFSSLMPKDYDKAAVTTEVRLPEKLKAPLEAGASLGEIIYSYNGEEIGRAALCLSKPVSRSIFRMIFGSFCKYVLNLWVMLPLGVLALTLLIRRSIAIRRAEEMRRKRKNYNRRNFYN